MKSFFIFLIYFILLQGSFSDQELIAEIASYKLLIKPTGVKSDLHEKAKTLADWARETTILVEANKRGIKVGKADVVESLDSCNPNHDAILRKMQLLHQKLPEAWGRAKENPKLEKDIYEQELSSLITYRQWESFLHTEAGAETIRRMKTIPLPNKDDLYRTDEEGFRHLVQKKLRSEILSERFDEKEFEFICKGLSPHEVDIKRRELEHRIWNKWLLNRYLYPNLIIHDSELVPYFNEYINHDSVYKPFGSFEYQLSHQDIILPSHLLMASMLIIGLLIIVSLVVRKKYKV